MSDREKKFEEKEKEKKIRKRRKEEMARRTFFHMCDTSCCGGM